ncbi:Rho termination factor N-terminal domain-containing protein [Ruminococcus sp. Marseille-P6503]|uniref:Rho termination factor N-terminal domain-containing protein n=1 Tax=Ruminococcus sp. Marseille-P6503 TaxID=2364796 RepID=UPI000F525D4E|nr:Rho termination factor N-terminal domain-containing protein [Ruminococcus sp. Marseille-P6503]
MAKTVGLTFPVEHLADENGDISFDKMTVTQLRKYAKDNGIDIGSAAKKNAIIQAIVASGDDMDNEDETEV